MQNPFSIKNAIHRPLKTIKNKVLLYLFLYIGIPCLVAFLFFLFIIVFLIISGQEEELNKNICVMFPLNTVDKKADEILNDKCYKKSLHYAEEQTNVPWQIIAAVDYASFKQGRSDNRKVTVNGDDRPVSNEEALVTIGEDIQIANTLRNIDGSEKRDKDGLLINTIFPNLINTTPSQAEGEIKNINMNDVIRVLERYRCYDILRTVFKMEAPNYGDVTGKPDFKKAFSEKCILDKSFKEGGEETTYSQQSKVDKWLWSGLIQNEEGLKKALFDKKSRQFGAIAFYKHIVDGDTCAGSSSVTPTGPYAKRVVDLAMAQVGKQYVWGGPGPYASWDSCDASNVAKSPNLDCNVFDCSGLVGWAWYWGSDKKVSLAHSSESFLTLQPVDRNDIQPGDIIVFDNSAYGGGYGGHTGLYVGNDTYVHASYPDACGSGCGILTAPLSSTTLPINGIVRPTVP